MSVKLLGITRFFQDTLYLINANILANEKCFLQNVMNPKIKMILKKLRKVV